MARRSSAISSPSTQVADIKDLLDNFLNLIGDADLRTKVRKLIPAFHALRDLGSGLMPEHAGEASRDRILAYLRKYPRTLIDGDELLVVSGIGEWARRVRELRVEFGWPIYTGVTIQEIADEQEEIVADIERTLGVARDDIKPEHYILLRPDQDREAAHRWNQLNEIRKLDLGVKAKILRYMRQNVGKTVTGEELRYLAKQKKEWARRTRELRTEDGWSVVTRMQGRADLDIGEYLLESDDQAEEHDRKIPDGVRVEVLERDKFKCTYCGWRHEDLQPSDPRKFVELHHILNHADRGPNTPSNLATLCNVHHDLVHKGQIQWNGNGWLDVANAKVVEFQLSPPE